MFGVGCRIVFKALAPGHRQPTGRAGFAEKQIGGGPATLIAWPPHLKYRLDLVDPWHGDGLAGVENDDCVGVDRCHFLHQLVLFAGEAKDRREACPKENHCNLGVLGCGDGGFVVSYTLFWGIPAESPCTPPWNAPVPARRLPSREILALVPMACRYIQ